jgi:V/A-type H+-transporting ATPase subunit I
MSKVSVTGAKPVMGDVIETVHSLNLVHLSEYDGSWEGFVQGDPAEGAEDASERLVTVRSLIATLGVDRETVGDHSVGDLESELAAVRERTNEIDDRRSAVEEELRTVRERIETLDPFVDLGVDLDLLSGYRTLSTAVGVGDAAAVRAAVEGAEGIAESQVITGDGRALAVFARPEGASVTDEGGPNPLDEALVGVEFERLTVPEFDNPNPEVQRRQLRNRREQLESRLADVEGEIEALREEAGAFLVAAEDRLTVQVQKTEAPLAFATTQNSFVAEGWVPTDRVADLEGALVDAVGDRVEFEELERASYSEKGVPEDREPVEEPDPGTGAGGTDPTPAPDGGTAAAGAGAVTMRDSPPTMLDHSAATNPMEVLVEAYGKPKYTEFDPTVLIFLTFPLFFGFMIGDLGYGILYVGIGYALYSRADSDAIRALGGLGMWAGLFTGIFGVLYGEFFGLHELGEIVWEGPVGAAIGIESTPIHKGLQPKYTAFATGWLVISLFVGLVHVGGGYVLGFFKEWYNHGLQAAVFEKGSWVAMMFGVWAWIFSTHLADSKPDFLFEVFAAGGELTAVDIGFTGLPEVVGLAGLGLFGVGFVGLVIGEGLLAIEVLQAIVNVLSYVRLMAVLLAKAGMAFVVNLLVFGAYETPDGEFHFTALEGGVHGEELFPGLVNADGLLGIAGLLAGIALLVVGHLFVLALGVTSAGLQGVRLEYVEFFGKFYDGGGRTYDPFGHSGDHTTED